MWAQILGFLGGGLLAGVAFIVLAYRAERRAGRDD
jgi:hypothetical protein